MALSLEAFVSTFGDAKYQKIRKRGYIAYNDKHVLSFNFDRDNGVMFGKVMPSQRSGAYNVKVFVERDTIKECICECANGQALCHHMIAFCYFAMKDVSSTDLENQWKKPRANKPVESVKTIDEIYQSKAVPNIFKKPVTEDDISNLVKRITEVSPYCGLAWIAQPEPSVAAQNVSFIVFQEIITSEGFLTCDDPAAYLLSALRVTKAQVVEIEKLTREQREEGLWFRVREGRLTGSKVGKIMWHIQTKRFPISFFKTLFDMYNAGGSMSIQHGTSNEKCAIKEYEKRYNCTVDKCGFVLHENGIIGSSPDGLVGQDIVCEFKCPLTMARIGNIHQYILQSKSCYLKEDKNGNLNFNFEAPLADHRKLAMEYYHQCQCHMYVTGRRICHFGIWLPSDFRKFDVPWDPEWSKTADILIDFYKKKYVPNYFNPNGVRSESNK